jgi:phage-related protein
VKSGLTDIFNALSQVPNLIKSLKDSVVGAFSDLADKVKGGLADIFNALSKLPDLVKDLKDKVVGAFSDLADKVKGGFAWFIDQVSQLPDRVRDITSKIEDSFRWFIDQVVQLPGIVKNVTDNLIGDVEHGVGGIVGWIRSEFENFRNTINSWFTGARDWFGSATQDLKALGAAFMGFVNAVQNLPSEFENILKPIIDFFENALNGLKEFAKDPQGWLKDHLVVPVANAIKAAAAVIWDLMKDLGDIIWQGLSWLWNKVVSGVTWLSNKVTDLFAMVLGWGLKTVATIRDTFLGVLNAIVTPPKETQKEVEEILENALSRTGGVAENLWYIGSELVKPFWLMTITPFVIRGLVNTIGDAEFSVKLAGTGGSWNIRLGELADALVHGLEMYYSGFGIGLSMGIANMLMVNIGQLYTPRIVQYYDQKIQNILGDVLEQEIKEGATINMFLKPVTEHELIDYARRMLAMSKGIEDEKTLKALLATVRAYLKIYGLPKWYIDFLTSDPEKLAIKFQDRFGAERKIYLSYLFELPTYSDLARMTQRDIFPDVKTMQKVGWVRGWNEDLTAMMYLLTFNYPSFEKLWSFYMRAVSGMLWFNPPDIMRTVYAIEANQLKAGVPVTPIDLQRALQSPDQVKAFELAINTYFKWMAYSSFSWFTPTTEVYGVNVGQEIVSRLGGWTADSWILADTAADIPGRIDLRWMSRYSIIQYMGDKFNASNIKFESYAPLVDAVPKLIDTSPASSIQLDLRWFSKLLQATGLHPAWVPVVSVAENIMAIADEMTLLRSGWLNLFKEGMINVTDAERYLSGLLVTSYQVGYWDPVSKAWTSGWINLPVRWLPHERRLIELRMAIDRVMDVFREAYNYIKSGIRTLSISVADARQRLAALIDRLNQHYRALTKVITGQEFELKLDSDYIDLWLYAQELAQDIEAVERVRAWWSRVSGYLLYRIMYGYVTDQDVDNFINTVANYIPLFPKEVEAYRGITKALFGIVRKESIPSPSTLATFAEYLVLDPDLIKQTLAKYNVPPEYWDLWTKYISVKPVKGDYKQVLSAALKALRYGAITQDYWESLLKGATAYGFTPAEISLIELMAELELAIDNAKEWRPSLPSLISMIDYVPEAVNLLDYYNVDPVFKPIVEKYAHVKPLADEVRALINEYFRAKRYTTIPSDLDALVMSIAKQLGFTDEELMLRNLTIELTELADNAKQWTPTPITLATLSEYLTLPNDMILGALKAHRIPDEWINVWMQYITVKPLKSYYKSLISTALKALRYNVITGDEWKKIISDATKFGFTDAELELISKNAELELAIDNAKEYIPTPSTLATMADYVPEVKNYTSQVLQARNITGVWAELWTKYIYIKPLYNDLNKWANSMFTLAERSIIDMSQLDPVFKILSTYGWENLEIEMARRTILAEQIRNAFEDVIGTPRALAGMARYTDRAADWAFSRAAKLIDALPTDDNTKAVLKEMWKQYITAYQANEEIRSYMNELINAYAHGALDDAGLEAELDYLRKLGVPELRLALVRRTAYLRRARIAARG